MNGDDGTPLCGRFHVQGFWFTDFENKNSHRRLSTNETNKFHKDLSTGREKNKDFRKKRIGGRTKKSEPQASAQPANPAQGYAYQYPYAWPSMPMLPPPPPTPSYPDLSKVEKKGEMKNNGYNK